MTIITGIAVSALASLVLSSSRSVHAAPASPACFSLPLNSNAAPKVSFANVVVFGASWADDGSTHNGPKANTAVKTNPKGANQFGGRASNGPTFAEFLTGKTGLFEDASADAKSGKCQAGLLNAKLIDLALSGASCDNTIFGKKAPTRSPFSVVQQVSSAISDVVPDLDPETTLYVFLPATQDITFQNTKNDPKIGNQVAACYQNSMNQLAQAGAKHFMLANMYSYFLSPETQGLSAKTRNVLKSEVATLNTALAKVPAAFKKANPTTNTWAVNMTFLITDFLMKNAQEFYGADAEVVEACSKGGKAVGDCADVGADQFFWWDGHHPTRRTHDLFAQLMFNRLSKNPDTGKLV
ncbi:hypothetical protein BJ742DRAFT_371047 [Cladochytrium replicatum]|nr:hypothetical protein BJ742DRAFT_371047 [Cladochytrium replicatum]